MVNPVERQRIIAPADLDLHLPELERQAMTIRLQMRSGVLAPRDGYRRLRDNRATGHALISACRAGLSMPLHASRQAFGKRTERVPYVSDKERGICLEHCNEALRQLQQDVDTLHRQFLAIAEPAWPTPPPIAAQPGRHPLIFAQAPHAWLFAAQKPIAPWDLAAGEGLGTYVRLNAAPVSQHPQACQGVLGQGLFGHVELFLDRLAHRLVAVKTLTDPSEEGREKALRELDIGQSLSSPFVATAHAINLGESPYAQQQYLVSEFVPGKSLSRHLKDGELSAPLLQSALLDVLTALHDCHQQNVVHLDVHADNLIVGPDNVIKLIDFGEAEFSDDLEKQDIDITMAHKAAQRLLFGLERQAGRVLVGAQTLPFADLLEDLFAQLHATSVIPSRRQLRDHPIFADLSQPERPPFLVMHELVPEG